MKNQTLTTKQTRLVSHRYWRAGRNLTLRYIEATIALVRAHQHRKQLKALFKELGYWH
jgi:hypothetical protein